MTQQVFERYGEYYDLLYRDKDYEAETQYVLDILFQANPITKTILEFGSGTGKHGWLLASKGLRVTGIERSASMVAASRSRRGPGGDAGSFEAVEGDITSTKLNRKFDGVLALFHVVSYQTSDNDVAATFDNAARHLNPGGLFFFDVWHGPAVLHLGPVRREKRVEDEKTELVRIAEPDLDKEERNIVTVRYSVRAKSKLDGKVAQFREEHRMRYFFPDEIAQFAALSGFKVERSEEFLTGRSPSRETWGVAYLLRKQ
jgi:SAM-dependent methyltransferase